METPNDDEEVDKSQILPSKNLSCCNWAYSFQHYSCSAWYKTQISWIENIAYEKFKKSQIVFLYRTKQSWFIRSNSRNKRDMSNGPKLWVHDWGQRTDAMQQIIGHYQSFKKLLILTTIYIF